jgi:hypothetical protein
MMESLRRTQTPSKNLVVLPSLYSRIAGHRGGIVNVSSGAAKCCSPRRIRGLRGEQKGAIDASTIGLAKEVAEQEIRVPRSTIQLKALPN